jgi:hypothetical protein
LLTALDSVSDPDLAATAQCISQLPVDHNLLTDTDHQQGNRGYEENMDERTHRIATHQPQQPQKYQDNSNRPQHLILLSDGSFLLPAIASPCLPELIKQSMIRTHSCVK